MERVAVMLGEKQVGMLTVQPEGLYACYRAEYRLARPEMLRLFAVGEKGELRLGTPEPRNGLFCLGRRISAREGEGIGALLRGELRRPGEEEGWREAADPAALFSGEELRRQVKDCSGALTRQPSGRRQLALPFDCRQPFPLPGLFCFACIRTINGRQYAVFTFNKEEQPVFP